MAAIEAERYYEPGWRMITVTAQFLNAFTIMKYPTIKNASPAARAR
jgi:hypothetical protein